VVVTFGKPDGITRDAVHDVQSLRLIWKVYLSSKSRANLLASSPPSEVSIEASSRSTVRVCSPHEMAR
jgi:hypothetical protein